MAIINFTVNYDLLASQSDSSDVGVDADVIPLIGSVLFEPVTADHLPVLAPSYTPRPAGIKLRSFTGFIDVDGRLKSARSGDVGVRLWANDPVLNLQSLIYKVSFNLTSPVGEPVRVDGGYFQAPSTDLAVNLAQVLQATGAVSTSTLLPQGPKGDRGYSIIGLAPALDGTYVQALVESANGPVAVGTPFLPSNSYNSTVTHATNAAYSRPPVNVAVIWIGSVQPSNAIDGDVWLDTSGTAPTVTTTTLNSLNVNAAFSQMLVASGTTPLVWSVSAGTLPTGLSLSTEGNLYGSPTTAGAYNFTVRALNPFGNNTTQLTGTVGSAISPTINTTTLGSVVAGTAFSLTLSASGSAPVTYALQSGSLPTGLSLNSSSGAISGTPSAVGSYTFTIRATNAAGFDDQAFTGSVTGVAPTVTLTSLGTVYRGFAVSATVTASGSTPITFAVQSGSLPAGLSLNTSTGAITGTPTTVASYSFTIRATNSYGTGDQAFTGNVIESTPVIVETALQAMSLSVAFSQVLTLTTGGPTITWSVQSGALPTGLSLNTSTGAITGTPTVAGAYSVTIRASNGTAYDDQAFTGSVIEARVFNVVAGSGATSVATRSVNLTPNAGDTVLLFVHTTNGTTPTATMAGTAMTQVGTTYNYGSIAGFGGPFAQFISVFKAENVSAGLKTFTATGTAGTAAVNIVATAYSGGTVSSTVSTQSSTGTAISHTVTSSSGKRLVNFIASPNAYTIDSYSQTQQFYSAPHIRMLAGDAAGGSSVAFTATMGTSGLWGSVVVEIG